MMTEAIIIAGLLISVVFRAAKLEGGLALSLLHGTTLFLLYLLISGLLVRVRPVLQHVFFAAAATLLLVEATIQTLTGLHLNWFVLSLLLQKNSSTQIGLSLPIVSLVLIGLAGLLAFISVKGPRRLIRFSAVKIGVLLIASFGAAQLIYGLAYFDGAAKILQARRTLPFFWAPHPYRSNKLLGYVFGPRDENPFSKSQIQSPKSAFDAGVHASDLPIVPIDLESAPNILLVVADSWRSKDVQKTPALMPNFVRAAQSGHAEFDYYSVSNCTHFSMYTLLTGKLATGYGNVRRGQIPVGLFPLLARAGYRLSTAESAALDWYDLSEILLPAETERWIADGVDTLENDTAAAAETIRQMSAWPNTDAPSLHLAFFQGIHFPYSSSLEAPGTTNLDRYKEAIRRFDQNLGQILAEVDNRATSRKTLVIVTSDHGEEFLSEGRVGHASRLTDEQVKVPLLILGAQSVADGLRSHTDIVPFIQKRLGLPTEQIVAPRPTVLANCDYDFPSGFALLEDGNRFDFLYDEGYLIPSGHSLEQADKNVTREAANRLLSIINQDR